MAQPDGDLLQREDVGDVTMVRVNIPRLWEDSTTDSAFTQLYDLVEGSGRHKFVLDLSPLQYFSSSALGKLVTLTRKARAADARLVLCNLTPTVEKILQVTRLGEVLVSYDNENEARQSFP
jgi:anti-sigma B factor antagonist